MALLLKKCFQGYYWVMEDLRDKRSDDLPLVSSPFGVILIGALYLFIVQNWGPRFMKNRKPYNVEKIIIVYNMVQVALNGYMVITAVPLVWRLNARCSPIDYSNNPDSKKLVRLAYMYFLLKILDLLDTIFFVLRKNDHQVNFLHVYHHWGMIYATWITVNFIGGGHTTYVGFINCIVHVVMYSYYLLTVWDPNYKRSLWWKKHITQLQLAQFLTILFLFGRMLFMPDCTYPKFICYVTVIQGVFMVCLFGDFYWKTYIRPKNTATNGTGTFKNTKLTQVAK